MITSSRHAKNWQVQLVYFDMDNPQRPRDVNHVAVKIDTGDFMTIVESTAKTEDGANAWNGMEIFGWWYDV